MFLLSIEVINLAFASFVQTSIVSGSKVMIYLADSGEKSSSFGGSCTYIDDCFKSCLASPRRCQAPLEISKIQTGGIWSRDEVNNPFANYFKVSNEKNVISLQVTAS
jgi:hypothetical protein